MPYLRCSEEEEAKYILEELHKEVCGDHTVPRSLVSKIIRTGYWLTIQKDAKEYVKKCDKCRRFGNVKPIPGENMTAITSLWPFAQWGINIMGPLLQGEKQVTFLLVTIDYFTKWVEAEALLTIMGARIQKFL